MDILAEHISDDFNDGYDIIESMQGIFRRADTDVITEVTEDGEFIYYLVTFENRKERKMYDAERKQQEFYNKNNND